MHYLGLVGVCVCVCVCVRWSKALCLLLIEKHLHCHYSLNRSEHQTRVINRLSALECFSQLQEQKQERKKSKALLTPSGMAGFCPLQYGCVSFNNFLHLYEYNTNITKYRVSIKYRNQDPWWAWWLVSVFLFLSADGLSHFLLVILCVSLKVSWPFVSLFLHLSIYRSLSVVLPLSFFICLCVSLLISASCVGRFLELRERVDDWMVNLKGTPVGGEKRNLVSLRAATRFVPKKANSFHRFSTNNSLLMPVSSRLKLGPQDRTLLAKS